MNQEGKQNLNPNFFRRRRKSRSIQEYVDGILEGDRVILSQAITLIESTLPEHREQAIEILEKCLPSSGQSFRIGITGTPGVGKSTFIETFGEYLISNGKKLGVLAVDPSSQLSGGSILGDKTRMGGLATSENAFIRPSPAGSSLGGVAQKTREAILLCEAAGYDLIFVETVGVGQSETAVHSMVDFFLLLLLPGAGDELQGIKRGIVEMADLIAINKADSGREELAAQAQRAYRNALHLFPPKASNWAPQAITCSAIQKTGIEKIWELIQSFEQETRESGYFERNRKDQARFWLRETIDRNLRIAFFEHEKVKQHFPKIEQAVYKGQLSTFKAARELLQYFFSGKK